MSDEYGEQWGGVNAQWDATPQPVAAEPVPEPEPAPEPDSEPTHETTVKPKRNGRRATGKTGKPTDGVSRRDVERVLTARDLLDDERVRSMVRVFSTDDTLTASVLTILSGRLSAPVTLIKNVHDAPSDIRRGILVNEQLLKDKRIVRDAARLLAGFDSSYKDRFPDALKDMDLVDRVAETARDVDASILEPLA